MERPYLLFCSNFVEENLKKKMLNLLCRKSAKHSQSTQSTLKIQIPRKMDEKQNAHSCCYSSDVERIEHVLQIKRISDTKKKKKDSSKPVTQNQDGCSDYIRNWLLEQHYTYKHQSSKRAYNLHLIHLLHLEAQFLNSLH